MCINFIFSRYSFSCPVCIYLYTVYRPHVTSLLVGKDVTNFHSTSVLLSNRGYDSVVITITNCVLYDIYQAAAHVKDKYVIFLPLHTVCGIL